MNSLPSILALLCIGSMVVLTGHGHLNQASPNLPETLSVEQILEN
jgi:hypothetical protein